MSMRIAYLTGEYPRPTDTFIQREVAALRRLGAAIDCFAVRRPKQQPTDDEQQRQRQATTYLLPTGPLTLLRAHLELLGRRPWAYLSTIGLAWQMRSPGLRALCYQLFYFAEAGLLARLLRQRRLQHLHNHFANSSCSVAVLAARLAGVTFSFTMHGPAVFFAPQRWRIDLKIAHADFVCCISHFCRSQAMLFSQPQHWPKLQIVHCGVEPDQYQQARHVPGPCRLLFVGRLAAVKGLPVLFQALAKLQQRWPHVQLQILGDGPERAALQQLADDLGLAPCVRFLGVASPQQVRDALAQCDLFVLPSFAEGVPVVLMEALASGVPVVASRIAGVPELVEHEVGGLLTAPGDEQALAQAIERLLPDAELRQRMGQAGRRRVLQHFAVEGQARRLLALFASVAFTPEAEIPQASAAVPGLGHFPGLRSDGSFHPPME